MRDLTKEELVNLSIKEKEIAITKISKVWKFINPNNQIIEVTNLRKFCEENGLNQDHMYQLYKPNLKMKNCQGYRPVLN